MSATSDTIAIFVTPAAVAVAATLFWLRWNSVRATALVTTVAGLAAIVAGFFVTYTVAWTINSSTVAIWLTAIVVGLIVAALAVSGRAVITRGIING